MLQGKRDEQDDSRKSDYLEFGAHRFPHAQRTLRRQLSALGFLRPADCFANISGEFTRFAGAEALERAVVVALLVQLDAVAHFLEFAVQHRLECDQNALIGDMVGGCLTQALERWHEVDNLGVGPERSHGVTSLGHAGEANLVPRGDNIRGRTRA